MQMRDGKSSLSLLQLHPDIWAICIDIALATLSVSSSLESHSQEVTLSGELKKFQTSKPVTKSH